MSAPIEVGLRIPPLTVEEWKVQFLRNTDISAYDAQAMAVEAHAVSMQAIYDKARLGEELEAQVASLARFITENVPGEPSTEGGAITCAIRIIIRLQEDLERTMEEVRRRG